MLPSGDPVGSSLTLPYSGGRHNMVARATQGTTSSRRRLRRGPGVSNPVDPHSRTWVSRQEAAFAAVPQISRVSPLHKFYPSRLKRGIGCVPGWAGVHI